MVAIDLPTLLQYSETLVFNNLHELCVGQLYVGVLVC
jgi:hypothetical protein